METNFDSGYNELREIEAFEKSDSVVYYYVTDTYQVLQTGYKFWLVFVLLADWPITYDHQKAFFTISCH